MTVHTEELRVEKQIKPADSLYEKSHFMHFLSPPLRKTLFKLKQGFNSYGPHLTSKHCFRSISWERNYGFRPTLAYDLILTISSLRVLHGILRLLSAEVLPLLDVKKIITDYAGRAYLQNITKTRLFKYIENVTSKNWKFSDTKSLISFIFLPKT